jgi:hypothetical protein
MDAIKNIPTSFPIVEGKVSNHESEQFDLIP